MWDRQEGRVTGRWRSTERTEEDGRLRHPTFQVEEWRGMREGPLSRGSTETRRRCKSTEVSVCDRNGRRDTSRGASRRFPGDPVSTGLEVVFGQGVGRMRSLLVLETKVHESDFWTPVRSKKRRVRDRTGSRSGHTRWRPQRELRW